MMFFVHTQTQIMGILHEVCGAKCMKILDSFRRFYKLGLRHAHVFRTSRTKPTGLTYIYNRKFQLNAEGCGLWGDTLLYSTASVCILLSSLVLCRLQWLI